MILTLLHLFGISVTEELVFSFLTCWYLPSSVTILGGLLDFGHFLKPLVTINLPKSPALVGNFCNGVKIYHFSREIILGQLL